MMRTMRRASTAAAVMLALAACGDDSSTRDGSMSVYLTDAPTDSITAAVVTIEQIYLQGGADSATVDGRVVLRDDPITVDLRSLVNTAESLFINVPVPGGVYAQLRFVISGGYVAVTQSDGSTKIFASSPAYPGLPVGATVGGQLQMPSFATSGLKVTMPASLLRVDGDHHIILVDFDVSRSFGHAAGPDRWIMHPVVTGGVFGSTGAVHGTVTLGAGVVLSDSLIVNGFQAQLGGESRALVATGPGTFGYAFGLVLPGSYPFTLVPPVGMSIVTNPVVPRTVVVESGVTTITDITIVSVN